MAAPVEALEWVVPVVMAMDQHPAVPVADRVDLPQESDQQRGQTGLAWSAQHHRSAMLRVHRLEWTCLAVEVLAAQRLSLAVEATVEAAAVKEAHWLPLAVLAA